MNVIKAGTHYINLDSILYAHVGEFLNDGPPFQSGVRIYFSVTEWETGQPVKLTLFGKEAALFLDTLDRHRIPHAWEEDALLRDESERS